MCKRALITGITGMDGSHMADLLFSKGYMVFGMERYKSSGRDETNINHIINKIDMLKGDLSDSASLYKVIEQAKPDEIYNFASQSFVGSSWDIPEHTSNITGLGVLRLLEVIRNVNPQIKFMQASSADMYGSARSTLDNFSPQNPYAAAKLFAHNATKIYRQAHGLFSCSAIFFNHESERRSKQFVTRKITDGVAKIYLGQANKLVLGNLDARRDWGYAPDYVEGSWRMLQASAPDDYIFATGIINSVRDFLRKSFEAVEIKDWQKYIEQDIRFMRPVDTHCVRGDYFETQNKLGWSPKVSFNELVQIMVENDIKLLGGS